MSCARIRRAIVLARRFELPPARCVTCGHEMNAVDVARQALTEEPGGSYECDCCAAVRAAGEQLPRRMRRTAGVTPTPVES